MPGREAFRRHDGAADHAVAESRGERFVEQVVGGDRRGMSPDEEALLELGEGGVRGAVEEEMAELVDHHIDPVFRPLVRQELDDRRALDLLPGGARFAQPRPRHERDAEQ